MIEQEKFLALDHFLETFPVVSNSADETRVDIEASFLERCDAIILEIFSTFPFYKVLPQLHDDAFRQNLLDRLTMLNGEFSEERSSQELIAECLEQLEALEDVSDAWLLVVMITPERLQALYSELQRMELRFSEHLDITTPLRALFTEFIDFSPLFEDEEARSLELMVDHFNESELLILLNRFLAALLEYGQYLQSRLLDIHPELMKAIHHRLLQEAENHRIHFSG